MVDRAAGKTLPRPTHRAHNRKPRGRTIRAHSQGDGQRTHSRHRGRGKLAREIAIELQDCDIGALVTTGETCARRDAADRHLKLRFIGQRLFGRHDNVWHPQYAAHMGAVLAPRRRKKTARAGDKLAQRVRKLDQGGIRHRSLHCLDGDQRWANRDGDGIGRMTGQHLAVWPGAHVWRYSYLTAMSAHPPPQEFELDPYSARVAHVYE